MRGKESDKPSRVALLMVMIAISMLVSGCGSLKSMVTGPQSREEELRSVATKFHRARYWGHFGDMAPYVAPSARNDLMKKWKTERRDENLVEVEVEDVEFDPEVNSAIVSVAVRSFKKPTYVVRTRTEKETWRYSLTDGTWWLEEVEIAETLPE